MRRSPPLVLATRPLPATQAVVASLAALLAAGLAAWVLSHHRSAWPLLAVVPAAAWWGWRAAAVRPRQLRWDGQAWWLRDAESQDETAVDLEVLIDLDRWLLLRARPAARWLPLSRAMLPAQWTALRATLFNAPRVAQ